MSLAQVLAAALQAEFAFMEGDAASWEKAARGILEKMESHLKAGKERPRDATVEEIELFDRILWYMGWDFRTQSRSGFLNSVSLEREGLIAMVKLLEKQVPKDRDAQG